METIRRFLLAMAPAIAAAGCAEGPTTPAGMVALPEADFDVSAEFNPQPEPPGRVFTFTAKGELTGGWSGSFRGDEGGGEVDIVIINNHQEGTTLHLQQRWEFLPPDPIMPFAAELAGIIELESGLLDLNGTSQGTPVHILGEVVPVGGGVFDIGGSVMFNPQPEPPGRF